MTDAHAQQLSVLRLEEIQEVAARLALPDHSWAEQLYRDELGVWTQAFAVRGGHALALTEPIWVPLSCN